MLKKTINIAYVLLDFKLSGVPEHILALLKKMDREKYRPCIFAIRERGELAEEAEALGCEVIVLNGAKSKRFDFVALFKLWKLFRKRKIDIVHAQNHYYASRYSHLAALFAGVPIVITSIHDTIGKKRLKKNLINKVFSLFTDRVIAVSKAVKEDICEYDRIHPDKIDVIPYGIDVDRFIINRDKGEIRKELGVPVEALIVGMTGRLAANKRHDILIQAMKKVIEKIPSAYLMIVGGGKTEEELKQMVEELRIKDHVLFTGVRRDIPLLLNAMDIFAMPAERDSFPIVLLEAGASALPSVGVRDGGIPEAIIEGKTGLLVSKSSPGELADALLGLMTSKEKILHMGEEARKNIQSQYTLEHQIKNIQRLYESILKSKGLL